MSWVSIDIEADGMIPGVYSMISLGAVIIEKNLDKTFYATLKPISNNFSNDALSVSKFSRKDTFNFDDPEQVMLNFKNWLLENCNDKIYFISDNNGFDWQFINWYFHYYLGENPFGYNSTNLKSLYQGLTQDMTAHFKHLRDTKHTHNALDDALGNAEAILTISEKYHLDMC